MSRDYCLGRADGLRAAVEIVRLLEEEVARRLARPSPRRTRETRTVRHKALQVARTRIGTALNRLERARHRPGDTITVKLKELGL